MPEPMETWKMDDFLQKLKKVVRIVLYGPAISQSDCRKAGPYQLPQNNTFYFKVTLTYTFIVKVDSQVSVWCVRIRL